MVDHEWDEARRNAREHGVTFAQALRAFDDVWAFDIIDDREDHGDDRFVLIGMSDTGLLTVVYTERGDTVRIISARRATRTETDAYFTAR